MPDDSPMSMVARLLELVNRALDPLDHTMHVEGWRPEFRKIFWDVVRLEATKRMEVAQADAG